MRLLEREDQMRALKEILSSASERRGRVVLVHGPAGIGKTSLVRSFAEAAEAADAVVRTGACDDLLSTRAFAPFRDIARGQSRLGRALGAGADPSEVLDAILEELDDPLRAVVFVIEDLQWADDATLDALVVVARRIERLPAMLVATFRDEEVDRTHPLRRVLGALGVAGVERITLGPLSRDALAELVGRDDDRADELFRVTGGNPFYALELAAAPAGTVPTSVRDAVLTRVLGLPEPAQVALEALSVVPTRAERWLLEAMTGDGARALDTAERAGLVTADADTVGFAHEIARRAVESDLPSGTRAALNRAALTALADRGVDATRILHHAIEAGDGEAVLRYGPLAAREAAQLGSHREALAAHRETYRYAAQLPDRERAALALAYAYELQLANRHADAVEVATEAVALLERGDDKRALADALLVLSRAVYWHSGAGKALPHAERAISLLRGDTSAVLAMAYAHMSRLHLLANRNPEAISWATLALGVAERVGHLPAEAGARINHGAAALNLGDADGLAEVTEGLELARRHGFHESVIRGFFQIAVEHMRRGELEEAEETVHDGRAYADDHQVTYGAFRLDGLLGSLALNRGLTDDARRILTQTLDGEVEPGVAGVQPRTWLAQALVRLGDPRAPKVAAEAWRLARSTDETPRLGAAASALLEVAWVTGTAPPDLDAAVAAAIAAADETGHPWYAGDVRVGLARAGKPVPDPPDPDVLLDAHAAALRGDHVAAAAAWEAAGYRYEQAVELVACDDEERMLEGLRTLDEIGATGTANRARAMLRAKGVMSVPRGPTRGTRRNPAGLTNRQLDVLALLTEGLTNAEIADRLVVSVRTVDHHVSAILDKLGVGTRQEAAALAPTLGVGA
jgi:ATP/maltotriose-dependent transcriptional regulator MalT